MRLLGQRLDGKPYGRCYMVSNLNCMTLITGKEVSDTLFRKFINDMLSLGHKPNLGKIFTSGPRRTIPRWRDNMGDTFTVKEIKVWSIEFFSNIINSIPMVISINVGKQFAVDREDGSLDDLILDDTVTGGHATVLKGYRIYDSRSDQKTYSLTDTYIKTVKGLFKSKTALVFTKL